MRKILTFDGGGIRGIISAVWLHELQMQLAKPIRDHFELVAGTSTGSLLAAAIAVGKTPADIIALYENRGDEIFPGTSGKLWSRVSRTFSQGFSAPKYANAGLTTVLKDIFGEKLALGDLPIRVLIVSYDTVNREPIIFKSWKEEHKKLKLWEACLSSCSAPTYFPSHAMRIEEKARGMIDGGVVANNPAACALAESLRLIKEEAEGKNKNFIKEIKLVSLGTGQLNRQISVDEGQEWGALEWAIPIIDVLFDGSSDAVDYIVKNIMDAENYVRLQVELTKALDDMDDASKTNIEALKRLSYAYLKSPVGSKEFQRLVTLVH